MRGRRGVLARVIRAGTPRIGSAVGVEYPMRTTPLLLAALAACSTDVSTLREEMLEATAAMDDLRAEVKRLRERTAPPPAPPAPPVVLSAAPAGPLLGGVGGTQPNIADLYWVLARAAVGGEERTVLALYRASPKGLRLEGVRLLNYDLQVVEYQNDRPSVRDLKAEVEKRR